MELEDLGIETNYSMQFTGNAGSRTHNKMRRYAYTGRQIVFQEKFSFKRLSHFNSWRRLWEIFIMFVSLFVIVEITFIFFVDPKITFLQYCPFIMFDVFFALDYYVIHHTVLFRMGREISDPELIIKDYGYVARNVHLIAMIPAGWIGLLLNDTTIYFVLSLNKFLRIHRAWRAYRTTIEQLPYIGTFLQILPFLLMYVFVIHCMTVVFFVIGKNQGWDQSWAAQFAAQGYSDNQLYFVALYFVLTTILTIGYGDITPTNNLETFITTLVQWGGCIYQVFLTGLLVAFLTDPIRNSFYLHFEAMQKYLKFKRIPGEIARDAVAFSQLQFETTGGAGGMRDILKRLPVSLRTRLKLELTQPMFDQTVAFSMLSQKQLAAIADVMRHVTFSPEDVIFSQNEPTTSIHFFKTGVISIVLDGKVVATQDCEDGIVTGEMQMLTGTGRTTGLLAKTYVSGWMLEKQDIQELLEQRQDISDNVNTAIKIAFPMIYQKIFEILHPPKDMKKSSSVSKSSEL